VEGRALDVGCGIGRNLKHLAPGSVGVDHNAAAVAQCVEQGLSAYAPDDFHTLMGGAAPAFDTLLLAHVVEHMTGENAEKVLQEYLPYVRPGGLLLVICPQEAGFASDDTHVEFFDGPRMGTLVELVGAHVERTRSFPFPAVVGRFFRYNETVVSARLPGRS
jgi:SAM-dependent methyltransferase